MVATERGYQAPAPAVRQPGPAGRLIGFVLGFVFWVGLGLVGNILFEWVGMGFLWPQEGVAHSRAALERELRYVTEDFRRGLLIERPGALATQLAARARRAVYQTARGEALLDYLEQRAARNAEDGAHQRRMRELLVQVRNHVEAAVIATEVYLVRMAVLIAALPLFLLAGLVGLTDGLVQRDLRKFGGGRERGQVYHLARGVVAPALTLPWVIYLAWPAEIHPNLVLLPFAALFGCVVAITSGSYKKYL